MNRVVVDASVMATVTFGEAGADEWVAHLEDAAVYAPTLLQYELQSVARKKCAKHPDRARAILQCLALTLAPEQGITWMDPNPLDVVVLANATGLSTYDATYLCLAGMLDADLLTRDQALAAAPDVFV